MKLKVETKFFIELDAEEASLISILIDCVDQNNNPETNKLYNISNYLRERLEGTDEYVNAKARMRPNGRIEVGTLEGVDPRTLTEDSW